MAALTVLTLLAGCGQKTATSDERTEAPGRTAGTRPTPAEVGAPSAPSLPGTGIRTRAADPTIGVQRPRPDRLRIDAANLDVPVVAVGVAADGQMALPPDPATIGWYQFGPGPADDHGSVVLGGHLDSKEFGTGPLVRLRKLRPGAQVILRSTDGSAATYRVRKVEEVSKSSLAIGKMFDRDGARLLRIITCGGPYDRNGGGYRDNLVVTATPAR
jgi:hypothetical protein